MSRAQEYWRADGLRILAVRGARSGEGIEGWTGRGWWFGLGLGLGVFRRRR